MIFSTNVMNIWCTLVMIGDAYARGAAVVAESLRAFDTKYEVWCMVTHDVSDGAVAFLACYFDRIVQVPYITHDVNLMKTKKQQAIYGSWIGSSFTKWNVLNEDLFPVDKVIFLDADMVFVENCDELFDLNAPALTFSTPWARPYTRGGIHNPYLKRGKEPKHGDLVPHAAIRKGLQSSFVGAADMAIVRPNNDHFQIMKSILYQHKKYGNHNSYSGFDEQLLAQTFVDAKVPVYYLHQQYNWYVGKTQWLRNNETPKALQWYNEKPWTQKRNEWPDLDIWFKYWDEIIDEYKDPWFVRNLKI